MANKFVPYPYQRAAIEWVMEHPYCGLFMEMGLGKSVCTLTAIQRMIDDLWISRALVVAPKKVAETTWSDEVAKWSHLDLRVSVAKLREVLEKLVADGDIEPIHVNVDEIINRVKKDI